MYSKEEIFNLTLSALLLQRRITNADTDQSTEAKVLRSVWDSALRSTLEDLDLDSTSSLLDLELITEKPNTLWLYAYKYPSNCAFFRRIVSCVRKDSRSTHISKKVGVYQNERAIFTNQYQAVAEYIPSDLPLSVLSATAGLALSYRLANMSAPLVTGKGALNLLKLLDERYKIAKAEAQEQDRNENFNYDDAAVESEFVAARIS